MSDSIISRAKAKAMTDRYQSAPAGNNNPNTGQMQPLTKFVHFSLVQFFELLTLNGIVTGSDTVTNILQNKSNFGIKLYYAQHTDASDCPNNDSNYIGANTIVVANTVKKNSVWYDMPEANAGSSDVQEYATANSGKVMDKGTKCPPDCSGFSGSL